MTGNLVIRPFIEDDVPELLSLMKELAAFEGYLDDFNVSETDLVKKGLCEDPTFGAFVAVDNGRLVGYAVHYLIRFTYRMRPTMVLKELFISKEVRSGGIGKGLFDAVVKEAGNLGAARLDWLVLPDNVDAKRFYTRCGGKLDADWERWFLDLA